MKRDKKNLTKLISAMTFGDGHLAVDYRDWSNGGNASFECSHIEEHLDYLQWKKEILEQVTSVSIGKSKDVGEYTFPNGITSITKPQYRIRTRRHPLFSKIRRRCYSEEGQKRIDPHYLKLLDWEFMAIFYMDDGYLSPYVAKGRYDYFQLGICTQTYSYGDNVLLKRAIRDKLGIDFRIRQDSYKSSIKYRLVIASLEKINMFVDGVSPYILPSFNYKIDLSRKAAGSPNKGDEDIV